LHPSLTTFARCEWVCYRCAVKLVAFDGDHTLWEPVSGLNLSDRTPTDDVGNPDFTYEPVDDQPLLARRDDGALFELRPEAREVMEELKRRGVLVGVISYNHEGNVQRILDVFSLLDLVDYILAEWHTGKDKMLARMIEEARRDGHHVSPTDVLLVDDDPEELYEGQCQAMGVGFCRFGRDVLDLRQVLGLLKAPKSEVHIP
jgi:magnesium-dependent phosphatase-1